MYGQGGLTGGFRAVNLDNAAARVAADAQGVVEADGAGRNHLDILDSVVAEFHYGAAAVGFLYLAQCGGKGVHARVAGSGGSGLGLGCLGCFFCLSHNYFRFYVFA